MKKVAATVDFPAGSFIYYTVYYNRARIFGL